MGKRAGIEQKICENV